jgi:ribosome maturation factor RimP
MKQYCLVTKVEKLIAGEITAMGFNFVKIELERSNNSNILRVYADAKGGITLGDCSKINYHLNKVLSVSGNLHFNYILEVSSPGVIT